MAVKIVTDSASDLPLGVARELGIEVVPIRVNLGRNSYRDGVDINPREFNSIASTGTLPTTSQPPPYEFETVFNTLLDQGHDIICLTLSSALSGTYQSAVIAAGGNARIRVIDTQLVSAGLGLLAMRAAKLAGSGQDLESLTAYVQGERKNIRMFATLENIEPIVRGGRLNLFARHAAGREGIKLIFSLNDKGGVQILERVRGRRQSLDRLAELISREGLAEVAIVQVECPGEARHIADLIAKQCGADPLISEAGGTVGTYAGRGAVIVAG